MTDESVKRKLTTIFYADVAGYSRLSGDDELGTHRTVMDVLDFTAQSIKTAGGNVLRYAGDAVLAEFASVVSCVDTAELIQTELAGRNSDVPSDSQVLIRIGINLGEVLEDRGEIFGEGVNIAARLEAAADAGGMCISAAVFDQVRGKTGLNFEDGGLLEFKNIARPIHVYRWRPQSVELNSPRPIELPDIPGKPVVAILPFDSMSRDPDTSFLADGFCEDLTTALSKIDNFTVVSRTNAFAQRDSGLAAAQVGRELGVTYIVEGSVRTAATRVRINAQLIEVASGNHLWAEKFDGSMDDVFDFQDNITNQIVAAMEVHLSDGEQVLNWRQEAGDPKAYELFLSARAAHGEYSRAGNARARRGYEAALAVSPQFVTATVALARTHIEDARFGWSEDRAASEAEAKRLLDTALEIRADHAMAHAELGHLLMVQGDFEAARKQCVRAVAIDPNMADAHNVRAFVLVCLGQHQEALTFARRSLKLNPGSPEYYLMATAEAYVALSRYQEAVPVIQRIISQRPDWVMALALLVITYQGLGQPDEARRAVEQILAISPKFDAARWVRCIFYPDRADVQNLIRMLCDAGLPDGRVAS